MNRKADLSMEQIIGIIILVVFLAVIFGAFFRPEKGWLNFIASKTESFARFIPGRDEIPHTTDLEVAAKYQDAYDTLYKKMLDLRNSDKTGCTDSYSEIPELNKIQIQISKVQEGISLYIINEKRQKIDDNLIPGIKPCIVGGKIGTTGIGENFYLKYILGQSKPISSTFKEVSSLTIIEDGGISEEEDIIADGTTYNLDYQVLYKPDSNHICFIPNYGMIGGCKGSEDGLRNSCFSNAIPNIKKCT